MNLKKYPLLLIVLCFLGITSVQAQVTTKKTTNIITSEFSVDGIPIHHKVTGEIITPEAFREIIRITPAVTLHREVDERGNISALVYDPAGGGFSTIDIQTRVKPGEPFPSFIFKTTDGTEIASDELKGQVVVLYFNLFLEDRFLEHAPFSALEKTINSSPVKNIATPIILTQSPQDVAAAFLNKGTSPYPLVADARNFAERFKVINYPSFIVIKKDGTLAAYGTNLEELKSVLAKLKN